MNVYRFAEVVVYIICFAASLYACSCIKFEELCNVRQVTKVRLLLLLMSMGLAYLCAQFIFVFTILN